MTTELVIGGVTVYANKVEWVQINAITPITPASAETAQEDTIIVDLRIIETRFTIDGEIVFANASAFKDLMSDNAGPVSMTYKTYSASAFNVMIEKFTVTEDAKSRETQPNPSHLTVKFTVIKGEDYRSA